MLPPKKRLSSSFVARFVKLPSGGPPVPAAGLSGSSHLTCKRLEPFGPENPRVFIVFSTLIFPFCSMFFDVFRCCPSFLSFCFPCLSRLCAGFGSHVHRRCGFLLGASRSGLPRLPSLALGQPNWTMKLGMTRWKWSLGRSKSLENVWKKGPKASETSPEGLQRPQKRPEVFGPSPL